MAIWLRETWQRVWQRYQSVEVRAQSLRGAIGGPIFAVFLTAVLAMFGPVGIYIGVFVGIILTFASLAANESFGKYPIYIKFTVSVIVNCLVWIGLGYMASKYSQATVNEIVDGVAKRLQQKQTPSPSEIADELAKRFPEKRTAEQQPFHMGMPSVITNPPDSNMWPAFMVGYQTELGFTLSPIDFCMYVEVANTQNRPSEINSYTVQAGVSKEGAWNTLMPIRIHPDTRIFTTVGSSPQKAKEIQFLLLDNALNERFEPYGTKRGWAFFSGAKIAASKPRFFRFTIRDTAGMQAMMVMTAKDSSGQVSFNEGRMKFLGTDIDLTKFAFRYFPER